MDDNLPAISDEALVLELVDSKEEIMAVMKEAAREVSLESAMPRIEMLIDEAFRAGRIYGVASVRLGIV